MGKDKGEPAVAEVKLPLTDYVTEVARVAACHAAKQVLRDYRKDCPGPGLEVRVRRLEIRWAWLVGFMAGSGVLGGAVGAGIVQAIGG